MAEKKQVTKEILTVQASNLLAPSKTDLKVQILRQRSEADMQLILGLLSELRENISELKKQGDDASKERKLILLKLEAMHNHLRLPQDEIPPTKQQLIWTEDAGGETGQNTHQLQAVSASEQLTEKCQDLEINNPKAAFIVKIQICGQKLKMRTPTSRYIMLCQSAEEFGRRKLRFRKNRARIYNAGGRDDELFTDGIRFFKTMRVKEWKFRKKRMESFVVTDPNLLRRQTPYIYLVM